MNRHWVLTVLCFPCNTNHIVRRSSLTTPMLAYDPIKQPKVLDVPGVIPSPPQVSDLEPRQTSGPSSGPEDVAPSAKITALLNMLQPRVWPRYGRPVTSFGRCPREREFRYGPTSLDDPNDLWSLSACREGEFECDAAPREALGQTKGIAEVGFVLRFIPNLPRPPLPKPCAPG